MPPPDERRHDHRVRTDRDVDRPLSVRLVHANGRETQGEMIDLSAIGVAVRFERTLELAGGDAAILRIFDDSLDDEITIECRVIRWEEDTYAFQFEDLEAVFDPRNRMIWRFFNRRRSYRVDALCSTDVGVEIRCDDLVLHTFLIDLSTEGCSLVINEAHHTAVDEARQVTLIMTLPPSGARFEVLARLQWGTAVHDLVRLGFRFLEATLDEDRFNAIVDYVMLRQRQLLLVR